jgi:hypothetical protein
MRALLVAVAIMLVACGTPLTSGIIEAKDYAPAHHTTMLIPQYTTICSGQPVVCVQHFTYFLPITTYHPDRWTVTVRGGESLRDTDQWDVPQAWWNAHEVGDTVDRP